MRKNRLWKKTEHNYLLLYILLINHICSIKHVYKSTNFIYIIAFSSITSIIFHNHFSTITLPLLLKTIFHHCFSITDQFLTNILISYYGCQYFVLEGNLSSFFCLFLFLAPLGRNWHLRSLFPAQPIFSHLFFLAIAGLLIFDCCEHCK